MKTLWKIISGLVCIALALLLLKYIFIDMPERAGRVTRLVELKRKVVSRITGKADVGQFRRLGKDDYKVAYRLAQEARKDIYNKDKAAALEKLKKASSILKDLILQYPDWEYSGTFNARLKEYDDQIAAIMLEQLLAQPVEKKGKVTRVYDGDTIELDHGEKIRYIGMNTPERGMPLYGESRRMNQELAGGKDVELRYGEERKDIHGRTLAYVFVGDTCVNAQIVREGLARKFIYGKTRKYNLMFEKLEEMAKLDKKGLWGLDASGKIAAGSEASAAE